MKRDIKYHKYNRGSILDSLIFDTLLDLDKINELIKHPRIPTRPTREENLRARGLLDDEESSKTMKNRELEDQIRVKDTLIAELKNTITQKDQEIEELKISKANLRLDIKAKQSHISELRKTIKQLKEEIKQKDQQIETQAKKLSDILYKYQSLIKDNCNKKLEEVPGAKIITELKEKITELEKKLKEEKEKKRKWKGKAQKRKSLMNKAYRFHQIAEEARSSKKGLEAVPEGVELSWPLRSLIKRD